MEQNNLEQHAEQLAQHALERVKLSVAEKLAKMIGVLLLTILIGLCVTLLFVFLSLGAAAALTLVLPAWAAYLIVAGVDGLLIALLIALRKPLLIYPLVAQMVSVLLERPIAFREIELEKTRLELETEKDRIRLTQSIESLIVTRILSWVRALLKK